MLFFAFGGFACFVLAVLFYLWSEDTAMRKELQMIVELRGQIKSCEQKVLAASGTTTFLMNERNKMFLENKELKEEVEKLQDLGAANISTWRELQVRQDAVERHNQKQAFPTSIEVFLVDKPKQAVSKFKPNERGNNETPKPKAQRTDETPKTNRSKAPPKGKAGLGRSYRDVEKGNSGRVPPSSKGNKGLNL